MTDENKPRRPRGDGGLYQRADGYWVGVVELPAGSDGKRRRKRVVRRDRNAAIAELKKLRNDVDGGRIAVTGNTTVAKWLDRWLEEIHADKIRPTTRRDYRTSIDRHIVPAIGTKRLDKLTTAHIRQMHQAIGSRRAAEKAHVILKKALGDAVREGMLTGNVAERIDAPKYRKPKRTSLSVEIAQRIIQQAGRHGDVSRETRWAAAFLTGARQSELLGLTWDRVDLEHGVMKIDRQLQQLSQAHGCGEPDVDGNYPCGRVRAGWCPRRRWDMAPDFDYEVCHKSLVWTQPKTAAGERYVPIVTPLLIRLRALHDANGANPHNLVWHHPDGRPIGPRDDYSAWKSLLIEAKVIEPKGETLSMHLARHTTASLLRAAGVDEQTRMEIIGHATVDAQRIYAHADHTRHAAAMNSLGKLLEIEANP